MVDNWLFGSVKVFVNRFHFQLITHFHIELKLNFLFETTIIFCSAYLQKLQRIVVIEFHIVDIFDICSDTCTLELIGDSIAVHDLCNFEYSFPNVHCNWFCWKSFKNCKKFTTPAAQREEKFRLLDCQIKTFFRNLLLEMK